MGEFLIAILPFAADEIPVVGLDFSSSSSSMVLFTPLRKSVLAPSCGSSIGPEIFDISSSTCASAALLALSTSCSCRRLRKKRKVKNTRATTIRPTMTPTAAHAPLDGPVGEGIADDVGFVDDKADAAVTGVVVVATLTTELVTNVAGAVGVIRVEVPLWLMLCGFLLLALMLQAGFPFASWPQVYPIGQHFVPQVGSFKLVSPICIAVSGKRVGSCSAMLQVMIWICWQSFPAGQQMMFSVPVLFNCTQLVPVGQQNDEGALGQALRVESVEHTAFCLGSNIVAEHVDGSDINVVKAVNAARAYARERK
jgi:hypothetical protein